MAKLVSSSVQSVRQTFPDFASFTFLPRLIPDHDSTLAMFAMFEDLGAVARYRTTADCFTVHRTAQVPDTPGLPRKVHSDGEERLQVSTLPQLVLVFYFSDSLLHCDVQVSWLHCGSLCLPSPSPGRPPSLQVHIKLHYRLLS